MAATNILPPETGSFGRHPPFAVAAKNGSTRQAQALGIFPAYPVVT